MPPTLASLPFEILTAADGYALQPPLRQLDLPSSGTNNATIAIESPSGKFVWRTYQAHAERETISYEHGLLRWLDKQQLSFTVPAPISMQSGETLYQDAQGYHALFPFLVGADPDRQDPAQMKAVGSALGELHCILDSYPKVKRFGLSTYGAMLQEHPTLSDPSRLLPQDVGLVGTEEETILFAWWRAEVAQVQAWQSAHYTSLRHQVIHGDYTPANTLVINQKVSAILDFDMALVDARAMDVAAGLYFAMRIGDNPNPWPVAEAFCRGYQQWITLTDEEIVALPLLMRLRSVVSTIWWFGRETAARRPAQLWRVEDLRVLTAWLETHKERLLRLFLRTFSID